MAFKKKTWTDRMVEYAGRRKLTNISTKQAIVYDVERAEGTVSKEGDAFSSQNMNDFEQRVEDGFAGVQQDINEINSDLGGYQFRLNNGVPEYKAGADAAWVPFRQVPKLIASYNGNAEYGTITKTYTAVTDSVIIAIAMGVTGNDYVSAAYSPSTSAKITGKGSVSIAFNQKIYGNNTNLSRPGMGILSTYICTLKNGDELTVSIIPFESQFRSGYNIVFLQS